MEGFQAIPKITFTYLLYCTCQIIICPQKLLPTDLTAFELTYVYKDEVQLLRV